MLKALHPSGAVLRQHNTNREEYKGDDQMTMQELEPILQKHLDTLEELEALQKRAYLEEQELIGIMEYNGATSIPSANFECKLRQTNTYDKLKWHNLINGEFIEILPDDIARIMPQEEMTAQQLVDKKRGNEIVQQIEWGGASTVESICKQYGRDALRIFDESKIPGNPKLTFKVKK